MKYQTCTSHVHVHVTYISRKIISFVEVREHAALY